MAAFELQSSFDMMSDAACLKKDLAIADLS